MAKYRLSCEKAHHHAVQGAGEGWEEQGGAGRSRNEGVQSRGCICRAVRVSQGHRAAEMKCLEGFQAIIGDHDLGEGGGQNVARGRVAPDRALRQPRSLLLHISSPTLPSQPRALPGQGENWHRHRNEPTAVLPGEWGDGPLTPVCAVHLYPQLFTLS